MSTCISSHGEYSAHTPDDTYVCTQCAVLDEDALIAELERLRLAHTTVSCALNESGRYGRWAQIELERLRGELAEAKREHSQPCPWAESYAQAAVRLSKLEAQRDKLLASCDFAAGQQVYGVEEGAFISVAEIRATFASQPDEPPVNTQPPALYRVGGKQPQNLYRITGEKEAYIGVCFDPNDTAHIVAVLNSQPAPTNTQTWEQGAWRDYSIETYGEAPYDTCVVCRTDTSCEWNHPNADDRYLTLGEAVDAAQEHVRWHAEDEDEEPDGGGVPDDGTEHPKPERERAWRDHNGRIWVLSGGKLHLAGWSHGIEPIDLDNMTPLIELPSEDKPELVRCPNCPSMAMLIGGLVYRCPLCLNETAEPVDAPPLASGGAVDSSKLYVVGEDRTCWMPAPDAARVAKAMPLAVEGCVCSTTAHPYDNGCVYELNADADCPIHGEGVIRCGPACSEGHTYKPDCVLGRCPSCPADLDGPHGEDCIVSRLKAEADALVPQHSAQESLAEYHRMTAIADARRDVIDKAKTWRAWWATVCQVDGSMFIPENSLATAVDVLARVEEAARLGETKEDQ